MRTRHLVRDDVRERRLAETRRTEDQRVIERFAAAPRRFDEHRHLFFDGGLTDVPGERRRPQRAIEGDLLAPHRGRKRGGPADRHEHTVRRAP
jgi:hypothetical protein